MRENTSKDVWADSAYRSEENDLRRAASGYRKQVHRKGPRNKPLSDREIAANHKKSKVRVRVEPVFGSQANEQAGLFVRVIGLARASIEIGMMNLVYNLRQFVTLCRRRAPAFLKKGQKRLQRGGLGQKIAQIIIKKAVWHE